MKDFPLVSVIMPAFNAEKYLAQAISSVLSQTYTNWELLIVNDGSTDSTQSIIDIFCKNDNRIKSFYQKNGKQGKARNLAIHHSNGEYLSFLDADDIWLPDKLSIQLNEIETSKADLVFSKYYLIDDNNEKKEEVICSFVGFLAGLEGIKKMIEVNRIPILTVLVKKNVVCSVNNFIEQESIANAEDYHLWLKLIMNDYVFWGSSNIHACYRVHFNSSTGEDKTAFDKLPYVYGDLLNSFSLYESFLISRLKLLFIAKYDYRIKLKKDLIKSLILNCSLFNKRYLLLVFLPMAFVLSVRRSKIYIKKYINA